MKGNRIANLKHQHPIYINLTPFLSFSSLIRKSPLSSAPKNQISNGDSTKRNRIVPEISLAPYNHNPQFSPKKRKVHNNSASFDRFLLTISKDKIMKLLLLNKPQKKKMFENSFNHIIIKSELNNETSKKDTKDSLRYFNSNKDKDKDKDKLKENNNHFSFNSINSIMSNNSSKPKSKNPFVFIDYAIKEEDNVKKSKQNVVKIRNPFISHAKQSFILKRENRNSNHNNNNRQNTRNRRELFFPNVVNSCTQISKINTLFLNHSDYALNSKTSNRKHSDNNKSNINCNNTHNNTISTNNNGSKSNNNINNRKISESNFDSRELEGKVNDVYVGVTETKNKKSIFNPIANRPLSTHLNQNLHHQPINSDNKENSYYEYHDIIWNNLNSISPDIAKIHLQKQRESNKEDNHAEIEIENENSIDIQIREPSFLPIRKHLKESTLKLPIDCHELINNTNTTLSDLLRDTIIYNEEYFNLSENDKQNEHSHNNASTLNEEVEEDDDYDDEIIENDDSVNEQGLDEENVSNKLKTFKPLKCFTLKSCPINQLETNLIFIIDYLNLKSISALVQVNHYFNKQLIQILYNQIGNIILKGSNREFLSLIKPSIFRFSYIFYSNDISSIYHHHLYKNTNYSNAIAKDLNRTIIDDESFSIGTNNNRKLKNILTAYSNYNRSIGYAQGMNFLVANAIYLFDKEEEVFLFFDGLVNKLKLENLYGVTNSLNHLMKGLGDLIEKHAPSIVHHLNTNGLNHEFFTTNWVLTLLSSAMRTKYLFMLWDFVIIFGWRFFVYFCVEIIKWNEDEIISAEVKYLSLTMKELLKKKDFENNFAELIEGTFTLMKTE